MLYCLHIYKIFKFISDVNVFCPGRSKVVKIVYSLTVWISNAVHIPSPLPCPNLHGIGLCRPHHFKLLFKGLSHEIFRPVFWPLWMHLSLNVNRFLF